MRLVEFGLHRYVVITAIVDFTQTESSAKLSNVCMDSHPSYLVRDTRPVRKCQYPFKDNAPHRLLIP
jgi:hypothetical protein